MKKIKQIFWESIAVIMGAIVAILMFPIAFPISVYKSFKNSKNEKKKQ
tara:strand:- start:385 stop:528 length:144 start_codon:yes stop_codon:yes gene_type:complete